jgi:hypothetical protein
LAPLLDRPDFGLSPLPSTLLKGLCRPQTCYKLLTIDN